MALEWWSTPISLTVATHTYFHCYCRLIFAFLRIMNTNAVAFFHLHKTHQSNYSNKCTQVHGTKSIKVKNIIKSLKIFLKNSIHFRLTSFHCRFCVRELLWCDGLFSLFCDTENAEHVIMDAKYVCAQWTTNCYCLKDSFAVKIMTAYDFVVFLQKKRQICKRIQKRISTTLIRNATNFRFWLTKFSVVRFVLVVSVFLFISWMRLW